MMITALRSRNIRQIIPNSNLTFIRSCADENKMDIIYSSFTAKQCRGSPDTPNRGVDITLKATEENKEVTNSKPVTSHVLQNSEVKSPSENAQAIAQQIISHYPEEPTTCCMSGCANCVWLDYAEKISAYYRDGGEQAVKEINEKVTDPNIKAFLLQELRTMKKS